MAANTLWRVIVQKAFHASCFVTAHTRHRLSSTSCEFTTVDTSDFSQTRKRIIEACKANDASKSGLVHHWRLQQCGGMILRVNEYDWRLNNDIIARVTLPSSRSLRLILGIFLVKNRFTLERRVGSKPETPMAMPSKTEWKHRARMSSRVSPNEARCNSVAFTSARPFSSSQNKLRFALIHLHEVAVKVASNNCN